MAIKRFSETDNSLDIYHRGKLINIDWTSIVEARGEIWHFHDFWSEVSPYFTFRIKDNAPLDATLYYLARLRRWHKTPEDWAREVRVLLWAAIFGVDA